MRTTKKSKKCKGKLTISKQGHLSEKREMCIVLEDDSSSAYMLEIRISLKELMEALTNLASRPCTYELLDVFDVAGKKLEIKNEKVFISGDYNYYNETKKFKRTVKDALTEYEVDGWIGSWTDTDNSKNIEKRDDNGVWYNITFRRYV